MPHLHFPPLLGIWQLATVARFWIVEQPRICILSQCCLHVAGGRLIKKQPSQHKQQGDTGAVPSQQQAGDAAVGDTSQGARSCLYPHQPLFPPHGYCGCCQTLLELHLPKLANLAILAEDQLSQKPCEARQLTSRALNGSCRFFTMTIASRYALHARYKVLSFAYPNSIKLNSVMFRYAGGCEHRVMKYMCISHHDGPLRRVVKAINEERYASYLMIADMGREKLTNDLG